VLWSPTLGDAPFEARVIAAAEHGYRVLEVTAIDAQAAVERGQRPIELKRWASDLGVEVPIFDGFSDWYPHPIPKRSAMPPVDLETFLAMAVAFEVQSVIVVSAYPTDVGIDTVTESFAALCDRAALDGLAVDVEFTPIQPVNSIRLAWQVVRDAGRANSGIVFDMWHFFQGDPDFETLESLPAGVITKVQVSDGHVGQFQEGLIKDTFRHRLLPGEGDFDLPRVLRTLDRLGALEMCGPEVLSTELLAMSPADAAGVAARAYDELAAELSRDGSKL
jgi:sugar phosphate isomerase/epimerase